MNRWHSTVLSASLFQATLLAGCSDERCTFAEIHHRVEMTREVGTTGTGGTLVVEACVGSTCTSASPGPSGALSFASGSEHGVGQGPTGGFVETNAASAKTTIRVTYSILENSTELVRLGAKRGDATLLEATAAVRWSADECHPRPLSPTL